MVQYRDVHLCAAAERFRDVNEVIGKEKEKKKRELDSTEETIEHVPQGPENKGKCTSAGHALATIESYLNLFPSNRSTSALSVLEVVETIVFLCLENKRGSKEKFQG